jgi:hypothetical protein
LKLYRISEVVLSLLRRWYAQHTRFTIRKQRVNGYLMNNPVLKPPLNSTVAFTREIQYVRYLKFMIYYAVQLVTGVRYLRV